jgi:hypothetical protein
MTRESGADDGARLVADLAHAVKALKQIKSECRTMETGGIWLVADYGLPKAMREST